MISGGRKAFSCGSFAYFPPPGGEFLSQSDLCKERQKNRQLTAQLAETNDQLQTVHGHVKEALELLGVDVSGYVPDSWTLREQCDLARRRLAAAEEREKRLLEDNMRLKAFVLWIFKGFDCDSDGHKYKTYCRTCDAGKLLAALADQGAKS